MVVVPPPCLCSPYGCVNQIAAVDSARISARDVDLDPVVDVTPSDVNDTERHLVTSAKLTASRGNP